MLEGEKINLRILEKEDIPLFAEWLNDPQVFGEYNPLHQETRERVEKIFSGPHDTKPFVVEKKDGSKIGFIAGFQVLHPATRQLEISYCLVPSEREKGYGTEALMIIVDFLFLTGDAVRIQAQTDSRNIASQKMLEKSGFTKEGVLRKSFFVRGEWRDSWIYSILREEWKKPKILT